MDTKVLKIDVEYYRRRDVYTRVVLGKGAMSNHLEIELMGIQHMVIDSPR